MSAFESRARVMAAMGDPVRLLLVERLVETGVQPVGRLVQGLPMSRQGARKHLKILEQAEIVTVKPSGREQYVEINIEAFLETRAWMESVAQGWEIRLRRLKSLAESISDVE
jgi:DNA-binding transcriptional ArsR family regulator